MSRKSVLFALIALALLVAAGIGWRAMSSEGTAQTVATATVRRATVTQTVLATGMLEANQLISVGARTWGQIETLAVSLGQTVKEGDLIAQIDSQDQQNDVLQAEAALANIVAQIAA